MKCKDFKKQLIQEQITTEGFIHLDECEKCRNLYRQVTHDLEQFNRDRIDTTNPFFATRVMQRIENKKTSNSGKRYKPVLIHFANALSLTIAGLFLGLLFLKNIHGDVQIFNRGARRQEAIRHLMHTHHLNSSPQEIYIIDELKKVSQHN